MFKVGDQVMVKSNEDPSVERGISGSIVEILPDGRCVIIYTKTEVYHKSYVTEQDNLILEVGSRLENFLGELLE